MFQYSLRKLFAVVTVLCMLMALVDFEYYPGYYEVTTQYSLRILGTQVLHFGHPSPQFIDSVNWNYTFVCLWSTHHWHYWGGQWHYRRYPYTV